MKKKILLSLFFLLFFVFSACNASKDIQPLADKYSALLKDKNGAPIPCVANQDCENLVERDKCIYGAVCHQSNCSVLIFDTCCEFDGEKVSCLSLQPCGNDDECNDDNICTGNKCNSYIFGGTCTFAPVYLGDTVCGKGICQRSVPKCKDGQVNSDECIPGDPTTETCNNLDDNCDGAVDDGFTDKGQACDGADADLCKKGTYTCKANGSGVECINETVENIIETCNGLDDDCDGQIDEDFPTLGNECIVGLGICEKSGHLICKTNGTGVECDTAPGTAESEICDLFDNDCDGEIDENLGSTACGKGTCEHTVQNCVNGVVQVCDPQQGSSSEICDGTDNDCDGEIDEGFSSTTCGTGVCYHTVQNCLNGQTKVCDPFEGKIDEICDDLDNDCDGEVDEGDICSTCNVNFGHVLCASLTAGSTGNYSWLNGYSCKSTLNESGSEAVFLFETALGGVKVTAKPVNINGGNLDVFILKSACVPASCTTFGYTSVTFTADTEAVYYIVVDGYNGASGTFDLQLTCKETGCDDNLDNDVDGSTDCSDSDCSTASVCQGAQEICTGGVDEDGDGNIDCADSDCKFDDACVGICAASENIDCGQAKSGTTVGGNNTNSGYNCAALDETGPEKIYKFMPAISGSATAILSNLSTDLDIFILSDLCQANKCAAFGNNVANFTYQAGKTYYLVVDGFVGNAGSYTLTLNCSVQ